VDINIGKGRLQGEGRCAFALRLARGICHLYADTVQFVESVAELRKNGLNGLNDLNGWNSNTLPRRQRSGGVELFE
jgi:hypothetical protein